ncbi:uncharacterized protein EV420DRAFT_1641103 [Desarmillaria tabescens]|uniref:DUF6534 domain-containing protein n=1 Tax=Armillaria tabescens TaxID=1929756 RepID=A0AA39TIY6_ARMTA|nr:uncharacterized protein EV420DRAFT_1641103 [Desarmillaria tabescens]KAK0460557.1 hypothetical protein EV420DRAFT_1641103 [Desarmillaria tabescens]
MVLEPIWDEFDARVTVFSEKQPRCLLRQSCCARAYVEEGSLFSVFEPLKSAYSFFTAVHVAGLCHWTYQVFITDFNQPELLNKFPESVAIEIMAIYVVAFIAQGYSFHGYRSPYHSEAFSRCRFYIRQIWKISYRNIWITTPIVGLALLNIGAGIAQTITTAQRGTVSGIGSEINKIITAVETGAAAACDISITATLCVLLRINRTGIKSTDSALDSLIILAINRGTVTSLSAVVELILYLARPESMLFALVFFPSTQFYVLSVVGSLNYREHVRAARDQKRQWSISNIVINDSFNEGTSAQSHSDGIHMAKSVATGWREPDSELGLDTYGAC